MAHLAHLVRLQVVGRASHLRRSLTLKPNNRHRKCSANCSAVPLAQNRTIAPRPPRDPIDDEKPRFAGLFVCARVDSNHHGEKSPQGPQPCASTNSATGAGGASIARGRPRRGRPTSAALASVHSRRYSANTCSLEALIHPDREARRHGSDQAPAGDLRLHPQVLGQVRLSADRPRHRQGGRARLVLDGARASREPREDRPAAPRPLEAPRDRAARSGGG